MSAALAYGLLPHQGARNPDQVPVALRCLPAWAPSCNTTPAHRHPMSLLRTRVFPEALVAPLAP
ncbi:MAG TPA: hypothetical protein VET88_01580, partial [Gammaproteobacteria bacterium]|nr:hypothetical protein [Gammaproteobacteria bacterium]